MIKKQHFLKNEDPISFNMTIPKSIQASFWNMFSIRGSTIPQVKAFINGQKIIILLGKYGWIYEINNVSGSNPIPQATFQFSNNTQSIKFFEQNSGLQYLIGIQKQRLEILYKRKQKYRIYCQQEATQILLIYFISSCQFFYSSQNYLYRLIISNGSLQIVIKIKYKRKISSIRYIQRMENYFIMISGNTLFVSKLVDQHLQEKWLDLRIKMNLISAYTFNQHIVAQTQKSILLLRIKDDRINIKNNFQIKFKNTTQNNYLTRCQLFGQYLFLHKMSDRIQFYQINKKAEMQLFDVVPFENCHGSLLSFYSQQNYINLVFGQALQRGCKMKILKLKKLDLKTKIQIFMEQKSFPLYQIQQISLKLGLSTHDYYILAWRKSDFNRFAIQKFLVQVRSYQCLKKQIKYYLKLCKQRQQPGSLQMVDLILKSSHEIAISDFNNHRKPEYLKNILQSAFLIKKIAFYNISHSTISLQQFKMIRKKNVIQWLVELSKDDVQQLKFFLGYFRVTFMLNFEQVLKHIFKIRTDLKSINQLYFLLPNKLLVQNAKKQLKGIPTIPQALDDGIVMWQRPNRLDTSMLYDKTKIIGMLFNGQQDPTPLFQNIMNQQWFKKQKFVQHQGLGCLDQLNYHFNQLCSNDAINILLQRILTIMQDQKDGLQLIDILKQKDRISGIVAQRIRMIITASYILKQEDIKVQPGKLKQQDLFQLVVKDKVKFHPSLKDQQAIGPLINWLIQQPNRINRLSLKSGLSPTQSIAYQQALRNCSVAQYRSLPHTFAGHIIIQKNFADYLHLIEIFTPNFKISQILKSKQLLIEEMIENYLDPDFNTRQQVLLQGNSVWLTQVSNLIIVILFINQKCLNINQTIIFKIFFSKLIKFQLFYQIQAFLQLQQHLQSQFDLTQLVLQSVNQIYKQLIMQAPLFQPIQKLIASIMKLVKDQNFANQGINIVRLACLFQQVGLQVQRAVLLDNDPLKLLQKAWNTSLQKVIKLPFKEYFKICQQLNIQCTQNFRTYILKRLNYFCLQSNIDNTILLNQIEEDKQSDLLYWELIKLVKQHKPHQQQAILMYFIHPANTQKLYYLHQLKTQGTIPISQIQDIIQQQSLLQAQSIDNWRQLWKYQIILTSGSKYAFQIKSLFLGMIFDYHSIFLILALGQISFLNEIQHLLRLFASKGLFKKIPTTLMLFKLVLLRGHNQSCKTFKWIDQPLQKLLSQQCCLQIQSILKKQISIDYKKLVLSYFDRLVNDFCQENDICYKSPLQNTDSFFKYVNEKNSLEQCLLCNIRSFLIEQEIQQKASCLLTKPQSKQYDIVIDNMMDQISEQIIPFQQQESIDPQYQFYKLFDFVQQQILDRSIVKLQKAFHLYYSIQLTTQSKIMFISKLIDQALQKSYSINQFMKIISQSQDIELIKFISPRAIKALQNVLKYRQLNFGCNMISAQSLIRQTSSDKELFELMLKKVKLILSPKNYQSLGQLFSIMFSGQYNNKIILQFIKKICKVCKRQNIFVDKYYKRLQQYFQQGLKKFKGQYIYNYAGQLVTMVGQMPQRIKIKYLQRLLNYLNKSQPHYNSTQIWLKYQIARQRLNLMISQYY